MGKRSKADGKGRHAGEGGRRRLADVIESLEKARAKRDKAQARVEALEALAEELAARVANDATSASEERGKEVGVADAADPEVAPAVKPVTTARPKAFAAKPKTAAKPRAPKAPPSEGATS